ncbi:MAG: carbamoyltransferase HypF [Anaerolineae bacterium]|nr:carbamoyltransferase HypF [Anaerolineae bacterium]
MIITDVQRLERQRLTVTGVVQGVGFRPFVYGLAARHGLTGFVGNHSGGVFIEVEGPEAELAAFQRDLVNQAPPLAHIERVVVEARPVQGDSAFTIVHSQDEASANTLISPDICLCADCLRELFDPQDRRYRYPFINCTNCGPRFTIIQNIPYDRPYTTMAGFPMCPDCRAEYENPLDRRFHAQPNACPVCGPQIWLELNQSPIPNGHDVSNLQSPIGDAALQTAQQLLAAGQIVAVKGLGGFHLACDASSDQAVQTLRQRKGRVDKPFAVMALDVETVRQFAELSAEEETLLSSKERPILLLRKKPGSPLSDFIAPGNNAIGVMLPYTPLHYLLLTSSHPPVSGLRSPVFIMTSANHSDEPIVKDNAEARERLSTLADAFLFHNRNIHARCDDSVVRMFRGAELPLRRSRGYAPFPVKLPFNLPPTLAVGGELKSTFCLTKDDYAFMSQHIGDMENLETLAAFDQAVAHFKHIFRVEPELIACDMHPGYLSTRWAQEQQGSRGAEERGRSREESHPCTPAPLHPCSLVFVQHHHAHIAAVMAEHQLDGAEPVIGFSFDGTGYGTDGAIWGGEVFIADYQAFERVAHLKYTPLAGGDAAVKRPYRLALAQLWAAGVDWDERLPCVAACPVVERRVMKHQLETGFNSVPTSSFGRLFDAVASLAGVRHTVTYEAQAAIEFEALAAPGIKEGYTFAIEENLFDAALVIRAVAADVLAQVPTAVIAAKLHLAVAALIVQVSLRQRRQTGLNRVALSGGVFQNTTLLDLATRQLQAHNFTVLTHRRVPPNDGGLALGQAIIGGIKARGAKSI